MVRGTKVDIPNPFRNNEYKPIFLSSTESANVIKKDDLNKRISEIEKNLEAVENILSDNRSIIIGDDGNSIHRRPSSISSAQAPEDMRHKIIELKRRLSSQKSLTDIRSESELSASGRLRRYRSTSMISDRAERQGRHAGQDFNDYVYSQSKYGAGHNYSESNLDLLSLPGFKYEYDQKDHELKSSINVLRDRLIRKRISDTALSLKVHPYVSASSSRSFSRLSPDPETSSANKRLSIIEDSYEKLTGTDNAVPLKQKIDKAPRKSVSQGFLRYSHYTNKSTNALSPTKEVISPQESSFSQKSTRSNVTSDANSSQRVLRMVKSIESMNNNPTNFNDSKLVDKEKFAKMTEIKNTSEKRVEALRKRLTTDGFGTIDSTTSSYSQFKANKRRSVAQKTEKEQTEQTSEPSKKELKVSTTETKTKEQQVEEEKSDRKSKTASQVLEPIEKRPLSRTSQYLKEFAGSKEKQTSIEEIQEQPQPIDQYSSETSSCNQNIESDTIEPKVTNVTTPHTSAQTEATEQEPPISINSTSKYSVSPEYVYTRPDLRSVTQNLTYRKSAFVDDEDETVKGHEQQRSGDNSDIFKLERDYDTTMDYATFKRLSRVQNSYYGGTTVDEDEDANISSMLAKNHDSIGYDDKLDKLHDLPNLKKKSKTSRLSVDGYKSHGQSHSISSNISVVERTSKKNSTSANNSPFTPVINDNPLEKSYSNEARDIFDTTINRKFSLKEENRQALRRKLSSRRSFNVLKQSMIETDFKERKTTGDKPQMKHVVSKKPRQKAGFFRRLAGLFKRN